MKKTNHPILTQKQALSEVSQRTGFAFNIVYEAILAYQDVIRDCVNNGVDIKMGDLGVMTWKVKPPRYGVVYFNPQTLENMDPIDTPGFNLPVFRPTKKWRKELKDLTKFYEDEKGKEKEE